VKKTCFFSPQILAVFYLILATLFLLYITGK
jgi:hypothetical protein